MGGPAVVVVVGAPAHTRSSGRGRWMAAGAGMPDEQVVAMLWHAVQFDGQLHASTATERRVHRTDMVEMFGGSSHKSKEVEERLR